ncbi:hypothetical protein [Micromonospora sp. NPDC005087]|uniref:hypothetical protein n=2 Tax=unclassified Micromonospora TaxID=2617518 RepID=UPI0036BEBAD2
MKVRLVGTGVQRGVVKPTANEMRVDTSGIGVAGPAGGWWVSQAASGPRRRGHRMLFRVAELLAGGVDEVVKVARSTARRSAAAPAVAVENLAQLARGHTAELDQCRAKLAALERKQPAIDALLHTLCAHGHRAHGGR